MPKVSTRCFVLIAYLKSSSLVLGIEVNGIKGNRIEVCMEEIAGTIQMMASLFMPSKLSYL